MFPHSLRNVNIWSTVHGLAWEVLSGVALLGKCVTGDGSWEFKDLPHSQFSLSALRLWFKA